MTEFSPWFFLQVPYGWFVSALWGALWGSFANVCIHRIPKGLSIIHPASHCPRCQKPIAFYDNIPLIGWLLRRGTCRHCHAGISVQYPLVELATVLLSMGLYFRFVKHGTQDPVSDLAHHLVYFFFGLVLLVLSVIDLQHKRLPDRITYPAIPLFFVLGRVIQDVPWLDSLIGMFGGYLSFLLIAEGYYLLTKREGLGRGDAKLMALFGSLLGWKALLLVVLMGSCTGIVASMPLLLWQAKKQKSGTPLLKQAIPFGPFLAFGALFYVFVFAGKSIETTLFQWLDPLLR